MVCLQWLKQESWEWSEILVSLEIKEDKTIKTKDQKFNEMFIAFEIYIVTFLPLRYGKLSLYSISRLSLVLFLLPTQFEKRDMKVFYAS